MPANYIVYKHTAPSGKIYIGITGTDPEIRWQGGLGYRRNTYFFRAILKYGWENIHHTILATGLTKEAACEMEQALIAYHKSNDKRFGYNLTSGGEYFKHSAESRKIMSERRKGKGTGKRELSEHTRQLMSENHAGGADSRPVLCVETKVIYKSINDAARATGLDKSPISRCCRKRPHYNTAGGFHWQWAD
jgi:hypothetical protein